MVAGMPALKKKYHNLCIFMIDHIFYSALLYQNYHLKVIYLFLIFDWLIIRRKWKLLYELLLMLDHKFWLFSGPK